MNSFRIRMINAGHGECMMIHICHDGREFNLLVDGGSYSASKDVRGRPVYNKEKMKEIAGMAALHGLVVSHVDDDHIGGVIRLVKEWKRIDQERNFFLIFNDYIDHSISFTQGEKLINEVRQLQKKEGTHVQLINTYSNRYISENRWIQKNLYTLPVQILSVFQRRMLLEKRKNHIYLTLLTPGKKEINAVMQEWKKDKERRKAHKAGKANGKIINNSSISFLLEYNKDTILFTGDSSIKLIKEKLDELDQVVKHIGYINLCHHGAAENNLGILELVEKYNCNNVFMSTNSRKYPEHPGLFMLYILLMNNPKLKIYLTNRLWMPNLLTELQKCSLSGSKVFRLTGRMDVDMRIFVQNLKDMEFPFDAKNLENYAEKITGSKNRIDINFENLINQICVQISKEFKKAEATGRIVILTEEKQCITIVQEDKGEEPFS